MAVRDRDGPTAREQPRPRNGAGGDGVAKLERGPIPAAEIAQRGDTGEKRVPRVDGAAQAHRDVAITLDVLEGDGARAEGQVNVGVHEARQDGVPGEVETLRSGKARRQRCDVADGGDALPAHGDGAASDGVA